MFKGAAGLILSLIIAGPAYAGAKFAPQRAMHPSIDRPDPLNAGRPMEYRLRELDEIGGRKARLEVRPWADGLWRMTEGMTAARYADREFSRLWSFRSRYEYIQSTPISAILNEPDRSRREEMIDRLSPAEKYDLLVGDTQATLSQTQWDEGRRAENAGQLAEWMGICEGSAVASVMYPEPQHEVGVYSPQGDLIRFRILDLKGLGSLLWSAFNTSAPMSGSRCRDGNEASCFDANPAALHLAVMNVIGGSRLPLYINRIPRDQVWSVPVVGYEIQYYDVTSFWGGRVSSVEDAIRPIGEYSRDPYANSRAPGTAYVAGVHLSLEIAEGYTSSRDRTAGTDLRMLDYRYDLELDAAGRIIGGEWRRDDHPDFIWAIEPGYRPLTVGDRQLGSVSWDGQTAVPSQWLPAIRRASALNQPLEVIVRRLFELAQ